MEEDLRNKGKYRPEITGFNINFTDFTEIPSKWLLNRPQTIKIYFYPER